MASPRVVVRADQVDDDVRVAHVLLHRVVVEQIKRLHTQASAHAGKEARETTTKKKNFGARGSQR
jgi:response regulator of citrate/malate metabolism